MKKAVVILTDGFEEIEAITPIDLLRRAGCEVICVGLEKKDLTGSHNIKFTADILLSDLKDLPDVLVLPGGPGADHLGRHEPLLDYIERMFAAGKIIAAICAAPAVVLAKTSILDNKRATCFPDLEKEFGPTTRFQKAPVIVDGTVITSRGAGTALAFSLAIVSALFGKQTADQLSMRLCCQ